MKKVLLFAVVVCGLAFTSCSKSGCECVIAGTTISEDDVSKDECDEADELAKTAGGSCKTT